MQGQTAWVWGGTSGIGLEAARSLAGQGVHVIIAGRSPEHLREALAGLPAGVRGEAIDATDASAVETAFRRHGGFQHLVLSIGGGSAIGPYRGVLNEAALRKTFEGKYWQYQRVTMAALAHMNGEGSITWVTGAAARAAIPGMAAIAATNGALHAMIGPLARELAPLRVNAVSPGFIDTPYWHKTLDEPARAGTYNTMANIVPVKRVGTPADIAQAIVLCVANTFMTGAIVDIDGGRRLV